MKKKLKLHCYALPFLFIASLQTSFSPHLLHSGFLALHIYRPCRISQWCALGIISSGRCFISSISTLYGVVQRFGTSPMRWLTRNTWVSTAIALLSQTTESITFAVLRPTPGRVVSSSSVSGTSPLKSLQSSSGYFSPHHAGGDAGKLKMILTSGFCRKAKSRLRSTRSKSYLSSPYHQVPPQNSRLPSTV